MLAEFRSLTIAHLRDGAWLTRARSTKLAIGFLVAQIIFGLFVIAGTHGWVVPLDKPNATDFVSYYAAGTLALEGTPERAYQRKYHHAAEIAASAPGLPYNYFYYPPIFLLLCAGLAALPYLPAFFVFQAASLLPCLIAGARILGTPLRHAVPILLAFPAVFWTLDTGQNAFLTAALLAGATLCLERRSLWAGLLFGALCYKPQFGLLVAVALLSGRHWRASAAAAATVIGLAVLSALVLGPESWNAFLTALAASGDIYSTGHVFNAGFTNVYGAAHSLGLGSPSAWSLQIAALIGLAIWTGWVWSRPTSLPLRAATLAAAIPLAAPVSLFYDLMLSGVALLWLTRDARTHGFLPYEKPAILALFMGAALSGNLDLPRPIPFAAITALGTFALTVAHAWRAYTGAALPMPASSAPVATVEPAALNGPPGDHAASRSSQ